MQGEKLLFTSMSHQTYQLVLGKTGIEKKSKAFLGRVPVRVLDRLIRFHFVIRKTTICERSERRN